MPKFTCVSIGFSVPRTTERVAESADKAAAACAAAIHAHYWSDAHRNGTDRHGAFDEYVIRETATRVHSTVRVYADYKP